MGIKTKLKRYLYGIPWWLELRKDTTPAHWAFGFLCSGIILAFGLLAGFAMTGLFLHWEKWNDKCDGTNQGAMDYWESFLTLSIGFVPLTILQLLGYTDISWLHGGILWT